MFLLLFRCNEQKKIQLHVTEICSTQVLRNAAIEWHSCNFESFNGKTSLTATYVMPKNLNPFIEWKIERKCRLF